MEFEESQRVEQSRTSAREMRDRKRVERAKERGEQGRERESD